MGHGHHCIGGREGEKKAATGERWRKTATGGEGREARPKVREDGWRGRRPELQRVRMANPLRERGDFLLYYKLGTKRKEDLTANFYRIGGRRRDRPKLLGRRAGAY